MPLEDIPTVIRQQDAYLAALLDIRENANTSLTENHSSSYYDTRIELLNNLFNSFKENHFFLITSADANSTLQYADALKFREFENIYVDILSKLKAKSTPPPPPSPVTNVQVPPPQVSFSVPRRIKAKLPVVNIPIFNGNYKNWRTFHDLFSSLIHTDNEIPNVQKLHYLKSHVSGEAERLLRQFDIIDANYTKAWTLLQKRFNNKKVLINTQLTTLFKLASIRAETSQAIKNLIDQTEEALHELQTLEISTENWDPILLYLLTQKLPAETLELWEQKHGANTDLPKYKDLIEFLESRFRILESLEGSSSTKNKVFLNQTNNQINKLTNSCVKCKQNHNIFSCQAFKNLGINERINFVRKNQLCYNCLSKNHSTINCPSKYTCKLCKKRHNTLIHINRGTDQAPHSSFNPRSASTSQHDNNQTKNQKPAPYTHHTQTNTKSSSETNNDEDEPRNFLSSNFRHALLSTALVQVNNQLGQQQTFRALIDSGSQVSFITITAAKQLRLNLEKTNQQISGLEKNNTTTANYTTKFTIQSTTSGFKTKVEALVIKNITNYLPSTPIDITKFNHIRNLQLADPQFNQPGCVDLLLGAEIYAQIIEDGIIRPRGPNQPTAQNTALGWILMGSVHTDNSTIKAYFTKTEEQPLTELNILIRNFWEIEETPKKKLLKPDDEKFENIYKKTVKRLENGSYQVDLPFKSEDGPDLGDSRKIAIQQQLSLERKFNKEHEYATAYKTNMQEYIKRGYMKEIPLPVEKTKTCYLPHHAVKKESSTTALRIVLNASLKTTNGKCLNEQMFIGGNLQPTLQTTLQRSRLFEFFMTADIEKMYLMISVNPNQYNYQRVIWRNSTEEELKDYVLTRVTFGMAAAPCLAIRTIHQLAEDEAEKYPDAAVILKRDMYVDDLVTSNSDLEKALELQKQLLNILKAGGFHLRKWASNHPELLKNIPLEDRELKSTLDLMQTENLKTLGVQWQPASDEFMFEIKLSASKNTYTKRSILSEIASLFDPFGWIAPCIMIAKLIMQQLWINGCDWDSKPPQHIVDKWINFKNNLTKLSTIRIPRWIKFKPEESTLSFHGFCDASTVGYAAVVYTRVQYNNHTHVSLFVSKTKVAPIKPTSLPRLELCGAVLLAKLLKSIQTELDLKVPIIAWTDSLITLAWIKGHPSKWKTFVANRVVEIHENTLPSVWRYIPGKENPADCASRGQLPTDMVNNQIWWKAPDWLSTNEKNWPQQPDTPEVSQEIRQPKVFFNSEPQFITKYSSYHGILSTFHSQHFIKI